MSCPPTRLSDLRQVPVEGIHGSVSATRWRRAAKAALYEALVDAGYDVEVVRCGGSCGTDPLFPRRRAIKRLTDSYEVPTLILDDGEVVDGSERIAAWAGAHPR
jgi:hypothetical protein